MPCMPFVYMPASPELHRGFSMPVTAETMETQLVPEQHLLSGPFGYLEILKCAVLCCTAKLISCLWAICPQMGKALA